MSTLTPVQMSWPVDDVVRNVRYFLDIVKKATGNEKSAFSQKEANKSNKPRTCAFSTCFESKLLNWNSEYPIVRVLLSSQQGPSIRIADY